MNKEEVLLRRNQQRIEAGVGRREKIGEDLVNEQDSVLMKSKISEEEADDALSNNCLTSKDFRCNSKEEFLQDTVQKNLHVPKTIDLNKKRTAKVLRKKRN